MGGWTNSRHKNYPTTDIPARSVPHIDSLATSILYNKIYPEIEKKYKVDQRFLSVQDIFVVKYEIGKQTHLKMHEDGCTFSANIALNPSTQYKGGGTQFKNTGKIFKLQKGELLIHPSQLTHSGVAITSGVRYILVAFIDFNKTLCECPTCIKKRRAEWKNNIKPKPNVVKKNNIFNNIINKR